MTLTPCLRSAGKRSTSVVVGTIVVKFVTGDPHRFGHFQSAVGVLAANGERVDLAVGDEPVEGGVADRRVRLPVGGVRLPGVRAGEQDGEHDPVLPAEPRRRVFGRRLGRNVFAGHVQMVSTRRAQHPRANGHIRVI